MTITDLKTAYNVLCDLDYPVPQELLVHMAQRIRATEMHNAERRVSRMTEEQLIRLANKQRRILRIYTADGRMIQRASAELTFREAIRELSPDELAQLGLRVGRKQVILRDETQARRRIHGYYFLQPGYFLLSGTRAVDKYDILRRIDAQLRLNWEIELI